VTSRDVQYLHDDRLGSLDTVTRTGGALSERAKFDPFGSRRNPKQLAVPKPAKFEIPHDGFTGHEADDDLGMTNMGGRLYDQVTGRFLTPDPLVPGPQSGQSYNPYSYVLNNPLAYTDPSGFIPEISSIFTPSLLDFDLYDFVKWIADLMKDSGTADTAQTTGKADKQGSAPEVPQIRPSAPASPMTESEWRAREDPLQNLSEDQRDVHEWHEFDKRVTRKYIDPIVKVLAVGVRVFSAAGGPELWMAANTGMDDVDDKEHWNTGLGTEGRIVRGAIGFAWGGLGALSAETTAATEIGTGIEDVVQGEKAVDEAVDLYFGGVKFTHKPTFNPNLPPGVFGESQTAAVVGGPYLQIGPEALANQRELLETLVHEEVHFRLLSAGIPMKYHHVGRTGAYLDSVIERYFRMKGWIRPPNP
jgi:RHS repeat-associated protein